MEYRDFVEQIKDKIKDFLPEKFADAAVEVNQIVKNNDCVLDGLMVRTEESNIAPTIYLNPYFEQIQDGAESDDVLAQIRTASDEGNEALVKALFNVLNDFVGAANGKDVTVVFNFDCDCE